MQILVIGPEPLFSELLKKTGNDHDIVHTETIESFQSGEEFDIAIDFTAEESIDNVSELFSSVSARLYMLNTVKTTLQEISYYLGGIPDNTVGFNGLPGFVNREVWEVTALTNMIPEIISALPGEVVRVKDRVGMVTPRVICMIINEAYYTVQEGTATRDDIDRGMKLGTGYPYGPFEWSRIIGLNHVYELLESLYEDTREERYKICPLLKTEYLRLC